MIGALGLLALGLALILAEVFFPSFGILSVLATLACLGAVILAFREDQETGFWFLGSTLVLAPLVVLLGFKVFPKSPMGRHMVARGLSFDADASLDRRDLGLVGMRGRVEAKCRPAGVARIDGRRVDVVTRGEWIDVGADVEVIEVSGNRVVVAATENTGDGEA
ncbi:MAG TPA: hypothetical protein ENJ09_02710 [Planctomycetes bacterium]|nr:hypothetical protein [Planctomycetota bacterium]